jgi:hypothetical protein
MYRKYPRADRVTTINKRPTFSQKTGEKLGEQDQNQQEMVPCLHAGLFQTSQNSEFSRNPEFWKNR